MKKMGLFVCDIAGTFTTRIENEEKHQLYLKFKELLELIRMEKDLDNIIFSFSTREATPKLLFDCVNTIKPYFEGSNIILGEQYMYKNSYDQDLNKLFSTIGFTKIDLVIKQIKSLQRNYEIKWVGFADDHLNVQDIIELIVKHPLIPEVYGFRPNWDFRSTSYTSDLMSVTNDKNLENLIVTIENYLNPNITKIKQKDELISEYINFTGEEYPKFSK